MKKIKIGGLLAFVVLASWLTVVWWFEKEDQGWRNSPIWLEDFKPHKSPHNYTYLENPRNSVSSTKVRRCASGYKEEGQQLLEGLSGFKGNYTGEVAGQVLSTCLL